MVPLLLRRRGRERERERGGERKRGRRRREERRREREGGKKRREMEEGGQNFFKMGLYAFPYPLGPYKFLYLKKNL